MGVFKAYAGFIQHINFLKFIIDVQEKKCCDKDVCKAEDVCAEFASQSPSLGKDCKCYCSGSPVRLCSETKTNGKCEPSPNTLPKKLLY